MSQVVTAFNAQVAHVEVRHSAYISIRNETLNGDNCGGVQADGSR